MERKRGYGQAEPTVGKPVELPQPAGQRCEPQLDPGEWGILLQRRRTDSEQWRECRWFSLEEIADALWEQAARAFQVLESDYVQPIKPIPWTDCLCSEVVCLDPDAEYPPVADTLERAEGESQFDYEDRLVRHFHGEDACLNRTDNGAPWAMPCTKKRGHEGPCKFEGYA